jgi:hypothetical protein
MIGLQDVLQLPSYDVSVMRSGMGRVSGYKANLFPLWMCRTSAHSCKSSSVLLLREVPASALCAALATEVP